jgi:hypothetical protein
MPWLSLPRPLLAIFVAALLLGCGGPEAEPEPEPEPDADLPPECGGTPWVPLAGPDPSQPRHSHVAAWNGSELLVYGTFNGFSLDLETRLATMLPEPARNVKAFDAYGAWTGQELLIWNDDSTTSAAYDPAVGRWRDLGQEGAPVGWLDNAAVVWTGRELVIWGGIVDGSYEAEGGFRYVPATDSWDRLPLGGPSNDRRGHRRAAADGARVAIWDAAMRVGAIFDLSAGAWTELPSEGSPPEQTGHSLVWLGDYLVVWGGTSSADGARYSVSRGVWEPMSREGAPSRRDHHTATVVGNAMIVFGGYSGEGGAAEGGGVYDAVTDRWALLPSGCPPPRVNHTATMTSAGLVIWGGTHHLSDPPPDGGYLLPTDSLPVP